MATPSTLADPTNRGNKPGDGPLRAGGKPGQILSEEDLPSTRSPQSAKQLPAVSMLRDLYLGTEAVRAAGANYLPQAPGEKPKDYNVRLIRSVFANFFRTTVDGLCGLVFRVDPVLNDDVPPKIAGDRTKKGKGGHVENIDNEGTHIDVFCRDIAADAMTTGHSAIFVEFPKTRGDETRADEDAFGIRPYWLPIKKENILSWRTTVENGVRLLTQVVLQEKTVAPIGTYGEGEVTRYRVLYRDEGVVGFRLLEVNEKNAVVEVDAGLYPTQDEIPIAEVQTSGSRGLFVSHPALLDFGYLNVAHYQQASDYVYAMYKTCAPILFGKCIPGAFDEMGKPVKEVVIGPNTSLFSPDPNGDLKYVSHDGASLGSCKQALDDLKADMGTLGLQMLAPQKRVAETFGAQKLAKSTSDSALSVNARALQDGIEKALYFHARYMGLESGGSVTINRDFEGILMESNVMSAFAQLVNAGMPPEPVVRALMAGGRLTEDTDVDGLIMEWMMGKELDREIPPPVVEAVPVEALEDVE